MDIMRSPINKYEEITIYDVLYDMVQGLMKSEYSVYFLVKGGFVLASLAKNSNRDDLIRITTDIDLAWENRQKFREFHQECEKVLTEGSNLALVYEKTGVRGEHHGWKQGRVFFNVVSKTGDSFDVNLDMVAEHINPRLKIPVMSIDMPSVPIESILVDKLSVLADYTTVKKTESRILLRPRDLFDVYVLASLFDFKMQGILDAWDDNRCNLEYIYVLDTGNYMKIANAFEKDVREKLYSTLDFKILYEQVCKFVVPIYRAKIRNTNSNSEWNIVRWFWS